MVKCQDIQFTPVSGRTVRLTGDLSKCDIEEIHGVIISITCQFPECDYTIKLGETIRPRAKSPYRVNVIRAHKELGKVMFYDLTVARLTDSSIFVRQNVVGASLPLSP